MLDTLNKLSMLAICSLLGIVLVARLPPQMAKSFNDQLHRISPDWKVPTPEDLEQWTKQPDPKSQPSEPKSKPSPKSSPKAKPSLPTELGRQRTLL